MSLFPCRNFNKFYIKMISLGDFFPFVLRWHKLMKKHYWKRLKINVFCTVKHRKLQQICTEAKTQTFKLQLILATVWCRGRAYSVRLSCSCWLTDGDLHEVYEDHLKHFHSALLSWPLIELIIPIFYLFIFFLVKFICP